MRACRPRQVKDAHGVRAAARPAGGRSLSCRDRQADWLPWIYGAVRPDGRLAQGVLVARTFNLTRLATELRGLGKYPDLVARIEQHGHNASRLADLGHAMELVVLMEQPGNQRGPLPAERSGDDSFTNIQGALFAQAIILYARATTSGDKGRSQSLAVSSALTRQQRLIHRDLVALRNKAIAHFDAEERQDWHSDCLVLTKRDDGSWQYGSTGCAPARSASAPSSSRWPRASATPPCRGRRTCQACGSFPRTVEARSAFDP
jgi:hypothetical protein